VRPEKRKFKNKGQGSKGGKNKKLWKGKRGKGGWAESPHSKPEEKVSAKKTHKG